MNLNNRRIIIREVADDILVLKLTTAKIVPKLLNFEQKTTSLEHRSEDVEGVQQRSRFALKDHNW